MTPDEIREKTVAERQKLLGSIQEELYHLRIKKASGQLEKTHRLKALRRDLARLLTLGREGSAKS